MPPPAAPEPPAPPRLRPPSPPWPLPPLASVGVVVVAVVPSLPPPPDPAVFATGEQARRPVCVSSADAQRRTWRRIDRMGGTFRGPGPGRALHDRARELAGIQKT